MFFDQVQIVAATVKTKHRYLIAPFYHCSEPLTCKQVYVFWHKLSPYFRSDIFSTPLQLFHKLPDQFFCIRITNVSWLALESVTNAHRNRHMRVIVSQIISPFFSLCAVVKRLKIIENRVWVSFCLLFWVFSFVFMSSHSHFSITRYPALINALVRSNVAMYNSSLVFPWAILLSLSGKHRRQPCHQHP